MFNTDFAEMYRKHLDIKGWPQYSADELLARSKELSMSKEDIAFLEAFITVWETFEKESV